MVMREREGVVDDQLNVPLEDAELLGEVELTTNLIIAASESDAPLSQVQVDRLLGVAHAPEPGSSSDNGSPDALATTTDVGDSSIPQQQRRLD